MSERKKVKPIKMGRRLQTRITGILNRDKQTDGGLEDFGRITPNTNEGQSPAIIRSKGSKGDTESDDSQLSEIMRNLQIPGKLREMKDVDGAMGRKLSRRLSLNAMNIQTRKIKKRESQALVETRI